MRDFKGMKRQRSRNRNGSSGGNVGKPQQNANRAFESNGPDGVKIRGAAQHVFEKYQQLARDALTAGDRVLGESYQQHAEHYFRVLRAVQPNRPASDIIGRDAFASGFDIDFEDDTPPDTDAAVETSEGDAQEWRAENRSDNNGNRSEGNRSENGSRYERPREDRYRDDRPRDGQNQGGQNRDGQNRDGQNQGNQSRDGQSRDGQGRDDRPRERYNRDDRPRDDRNNNGNNNNGNNNNGDRGYNDRVARDERPARDDRPAQGDRPARDDRNGQDRVARDERPAREDRPRYRDRDRGERVSDPLAVVEPQATPLTPEPEQTSSPVLRSHDGGVSEAPAFLQARAAPEPRAEEPAADGEARPKVRRRRAPRSFDAAEGANAEGTGKVGASEDA
jgi:hypothetical protein